MTEKQLSTAARWALIPVAAVFGLLAALPVAWLLNRALYHVLTNAGHVIGRKELLDFALPYDGAVAACLVLVCGSLMAPAHRRRVAASLLLAGGLLAWCLVGNWASPAHHIGSPVREWWPIAGTLLGGVTTFAALSFAYRPAKCP